jgi:NTE family protein
MRALVLSGGGLFGAWQAGAWAALAPSFQPDLIVGASVGSLNGYAIACGATPQMLRDLWLQEDVASLHRLEASLRILTSGRNPEVDYAVLVTDLLRLKPKVYRGKEVTWRHLAASCAVPLVFAPVRIDGRAYVDGGLLNPLPVYAAVDLGATEIIGLQALPEIPSHVLKPFVYGFRAVFGHNPSLPGGVRLTVLEPSRPLGSLRDALRWKHANIERWLEQGRQDAAGLFVTQKTFPL